MLRNRYRLIKLLIPVSIALYIFMLPLSSVIETEHGEVFPFFRWRLFSSVPDWQASQYGMTLHSIDGVEVSGTRYLIPSDTIRDWKALRFAAAACRQDNDCDETVAEVLYPIISRSFGTTTVEFSVIRATIDLHDIRDHIEDIAEHRATRTDFFQPYQLIGRWNTQIGRVR